jgi:hypothetical protein
LKEKQAHHHHAPGPLGKEGKLPNNMLQLMTELEMESKALANKASS